MTQYVSWVAISIKISRFYVFSFISVSEFYDLYKKEEAYNDSNSDYTSMAPMCYDHIWVAALALNCTETYLNSKGLS